ncbi:(2Fe-2S)-binding protein [Clostridium sp. ZS2-4]|uniref:(2Fe-2S)-binding protein n=1 Tax=Clostridium sp. ZS2-4 TaxID=2987703 RepID=UPI00227D5242|nr:2Fe-2S iron-sulfur cluster-binding protein [Clostridium sp. ZS2-4]MCY6354115.1 2Fe-2S iron-sulfur cluster-binding protein [Clostridium sp. ZS2-4]
MKINLKINGLDRKIEIEPGEMLADVLNRNGYTVRRGCDTGSCGLCTILLDEKPISSCSYLAIKADGHAITTIDGVQHEAEEIGKFLVAEGVEQCGYCSPGFVLTVLGMKKELKNPSEEEMKHYLVGNLCRCSGYVGHLRALKKYLGVSE